MITVFARHRQTRVQPQPAIAQALANAAHEHDQRAAQRDRIGRVHLFKQIGFGRQGERHGAVGRVEFFVVQQGAKSGDESVWHLRQHAPGGVGRHCQHHAHHEALCGIPAIEGVGIVGHAVSQPRVVLGQFENHRRGEAAQQGRHGLGVNGFEDQRGGGVFEFKQPRRCARRGLARQRQRQIDALGADQAERHGNMQRRVAVRALLGQRERVLTGRGVVPPLGQ